MTINEALEAIINQISIDIVSKANVAQSNIDNWILLQLESMSPDEVDDLIRTGGTQVIANELKSVAGGVGTSLTNSVLQATHRGIEQYIYLNDNEDEYVWTTAGGRSCPDCSDRSGQVETMEGWETIGLPSSGFSVCGTNCRCTLKKVEN